MAKYQWFEDRSDKHFEDIFTPSLKLNLVFVIQLRNNVKPSSLNSLWFVAQKRQQYRSFILILISVNIYDRDQSWL